MVQSLYDLMETTVVRTEALRVTLERLVERDELSNGVKEELGLCIDIASYILEGVNAYRPTIARNVPRC